MRTIAWSTTFLLAACQVQLEHLPQSIELECSSNVECPDKLVCVAALSRCLPATDPCVQAQGDAFVPAPDGNGCPLGEGQEGICLGGLCKMSQCGDGFANLGSESCDDGAGNSDFIPDACRLDCTLARCGDSVVDMDEACDDGATLSGDGCRGDCLKIELCGDGTLDANEACDDSGTTSGDGCRGDCLKVELCGDGILDANEACDDGGTTSGDGCRADCLKIELCGDGVLDANESCDDVNSNPNDGCDNCARTTWQAQVIVGGGTGAALEQTAFNAPYAVAVDKTGQIAVADFSHRVLLVDPTSGRVTRLAGAGGFGYSGDFGRATEAKLWSPRGLAFDVRGNLYIADTSNHRVRRVDGKSGIITTVAGTGTSCPNANPCGDGGSASLAMLKSPEGLAIDLQGNLYIADQTHRVRRVNTTTGLISTVAGNGTACTPYNSACGDGAAATSAQLYSPNGLVITSTNKLYIADQSNQRVRMVNLALATPTINTLAGTVGSGCSNATPTAPCGDQGLAALAQLNRPAGLTVDGNGDLYFADQNIHRVRKITFDESGNTLTTVAGSGDVCPASVFLEGCGENDDARNAKLNTPGGVAIRGNTLIVADTNNHRLRQVDLQTGVITTLAGSGRPGQKGDAGAASAATFDLPRGIALDPLGNIFVADQWNNAIRRIDANNVITTYAGTSAACVGTANACGNNVPATHAFVTPIDVAADAEGNVFVADFGNRLVRRIDHVTGLISTIAGTGAACDTDVTENNCGDGGAAINANLGRPVSVLVRGNALYIGQIESPRVRVIPDFTAATPTIENVVGSGTPCDDPTATPACGDTGAPLAAQLNFPSGLAFDSAGNLLIADGSQQRIRKATLSAGVPTMQTVAGNGEACNGGGAECGDNMDATSASINVRDVVADNDDAVLFTQYSGSIRRIENGIVTTIAGGGPAGFSGDGGSLEDAYFSGLEGMVMDALGNIIVVESAAARVRYLDRINDIALSLTQVDPLGDGPLDVAFLASPAALVSVENPARWLIADGGGGRLRLLDQNTQWLSTVAGYPLGLTEGEEPRARYQALLMNAGGLAHDAESGAVYVALRGEHTIRKLTYANVTDESGWTLTTVAGAAGEPGAANSPSNPLAARFNGPRGLAFDAATNVLYIADAGNHLIRTFNPVTGAVTTLAGEAGVGAFAGEGTSTDSSFLDSPSALAVAADGSLYVADTGNNRVRRIASGIISTVLGDGASASSGQGAPAFTFPVDAPEGLTLDSFGNLFVTSHTSVRLVTSGVDGLALGEDTVLTLYGQAPRESFPASVTRCLSGLAITPNDAGVLVLDACTGMVVELTRAPE